MKKTPEQIADLKAQWKSDPIWDIETTEEYEDYKAELLEYRLTTEREWTEKELARVEALAAKLGCSIETFRYIEALESRVAALEMEAYQ